MTATRRMSWARAFGGILVSVSVALIPLLIVCSFSEDVWMRWGALAACGYILAAMMRSMRTFETRFDRDTQHGDPSS
ncbi:hypothetical protein ALI44B_13730 [Leifsonia sp. ALI-44-B]|nr:hypothetical protein ALI44B_13730 [Leifsonia sp. ALI-44-B]